ncbi:hypothetical protein ATC1_1349 [Flexilinea flocculi]|uniref:Uncharacterized protein n=2 Tax=Flexilinea flocculi TaxID=1678840 RepID=A0A0S7BSF4_9CHLR|nr:hypothetical protein ATC1_1349 [Flexilinea flocculi]
MNEMITTNKNKALAAIHKIGRAAYQAAAAPSIAQEAPNIQQKRNNTITVFLDETQRTP